MIDFSRNHFELFGLPRALSRRRGGARRAPTASCRPRCIPTASRAAATPSSALALQSSARVNEAYRTLKDPGAARAVPARAARRRRGRRDRHGAAARLPRAPARAARSRPPTRRRPATCARCRRCSPMPRARKRASSRTQLAQRLDVDARRTRRRARWCASSRSSPSWPRTSTRCWRRSNPDGAAADLRARRVARAAPAQARGRHRPRHDQFAGRHGAQRPRRSCCPTTKGARCCRRSSATASTASTSATRRRRSRRAIRRTRSSRSSA